MSVLFSPLQLVLWGPIQPPRASKSQGISYLDQSIGAFNADFSTAFDRNVNWAFNNDFSNDFATVAVVRQQSFSIAFSSDFDRSEIGATVSFNPDFSSDFNIMGVTHRAAFNNDFSNDFAQTI